VPGRDAGEAFAGFIAELGLPRRLADVGVADDRFELIGKNAMLSIIPRANPRPIREPGDVVKPDWRVQRVDEESGELVQPPPKVDGS
jgi:hypothetical protein